MLKRLLLSLLLLTAVLNATAPTNENVTTLYVAMFDRAPDAGGLDYWVKESGLDLEGIAKSFFEQEETQLKYPPGTTEEEFITAVYVNLFNRLPDEGGLKYWKEALESGDIERSLFVLAVINGALGTDAEILQNKTIVGMAFAKAGLDDVDDAGCAMAGVTADTATLAKGLEQVAGILDGIPCVIDNSPPIADAGPDQTDVVIGALVTLDGSGSSDPDGDTLTYKWTMTAKPTGSAAYLSDSTLVKPSFLADKNGTYAISLVVNDGNVNSPADGVTVVVPTPGNSAPVADAGPDQTDVAIGALVTLDGSGSSDPDGDTLTYKWTMTAKPTGSAAYLSDSTLVKPSFLADKNGTYAISLVVNDGDVDSPADEIAVIVNSTPIADAGPDQTGVAINATVTLDGSGSSDPDGDTLTYKWTMTAKPTGSAAILSDDTAQKPTFTADQYGSYTIELVVNDGKINSASDSATVTTVVDPCPNTITHNGTDYECVVSPYTGKVWLDRNLGAAEVCTSYNDTACYGDYYQWGRNFDGHQDSTSGTNSTQAADVNNAGTSDFISGNDDWTSVDGTGADRIANWSKTDGTSVCPAGFRVPTISELKAELLDPGSARIAGNSPSNDKRENAFQSFLKLPSAGYRNYAGTMRYVGSWGDVWSSSVTTSESSYLDFDLSSSDWYDTLRTTGQSVRCLKE